MPTSSSARSCGVRRSEVSGPTALSFPGANDARPSPRGTGRLHNRATTTDASFLRNQNGRHRQGSDDIEPDIPTAEMLHDLGERASKTGIVNTAQIQSDQASSRRNLAPKPKASLRAATATRRARRSRRTIIAGISFNGQGSRQALRPATLVPAGVKADENRRSRHRSRCTDLNPIPPLH